MTSLSTGACPRSHKLPGCSGWLGWAWQLIHLDTICLTAAPSHAAESWGNPVQAGVWRTHRQRKSFCNPCKDTADFALNLCCNRCLTQDASGVLPPVCNDGGNSAFFLCGSECESLLDVCLAGDRQKGNLIICQMEKATVILSCGLQRGEEGVSAVNYSLQIGSVLRSWEQDDAYTYIHKSLYKWLDVRICGDKKQQTNKQKANMATQYFIHCSLYYFTVHQMCKSHVGRISRKTPLSQLAFLYLIAAMLLSMSCTGTESWRPYTTQVSTWSRGGQEKKIRN